jgi:hypothetical protein
VNAAGQPPKVKTVRVLLIAKSPQGSSYLTERLVKKGCGCEFASSLAEAASRIRANDYDLVMSATRLRDGGAFPLMDLLEGSDTALFYFHAVEEGCWWLPGLRWGRRCFGSSALRASDFVPILDEVIDEIRNAAQTAEDFSKQRTAVSILSPATYGRESSPVGTARPDGVLIKRKAAG